MPPEVESETPAVEVSVEVPTAQPAPVADPAAMASVEAAATTDATNSATTDAESPASSPDPSSEMRAKLDELSATVDRLTQELSAAVSARDAAMGQASEAQAIVKPLQDELATLRARCADYEVGAALANHGLPPEASALVRSLYASSGMYYCIHDWLGTYLQSAEGAALVMLKSAVKADPRVSAPSVGGGNSTLATLRFGGYGR